MLQRIRFLLLLFALALMATFDTASCVALDEGDGAAEEEKKTDPKEEGQGDEGDPKKEEPTDGEKPDGEEEEPKPDGEKEEPKPVPPGRTTNTATPPVPLPAGMAFLEGGRVWIGTERAYLNNVLAGRPPDIRKLFLYETPYHPVFLRPYFIGRFEITNAQYERFLADHVVTYDTASGSLANIDEIAARLVGLSPDQQKYVRQKVWFQLYNANKKALWEAFKTLGKLDKLVVRRPDGTLDEMATARNFRFEPLPRTLKLSFYSKRPPTNWPGTKPPEGEEDHPVRFVSYNDLEQLAEWAGMHIPTEYEWEWAARGPGAPTFPWGNNWAMDAKLVNWGGKITNARYEPTTLPVDTRWGSNPDGSKGRKVPIDGDGRSWCGCHHMVGNVAEWTSSWFHAYRGNRLKNSRMGQWVKVIRGGCAGDGEMLALRPACRNYIGGGADAPPYPENSFEWCGSRLAAYLKSGRDQLGPVVRRALRHKKMKAENLDIERFIGTVTRNWVDASEKPENHVYVRGRSHAIMLIPQKTFLREHGMQAMIAAWKRPTRFKTVRGMAKKVSGERPEWLLGVFHTDITLDPVLVTRPLTEKELAEQKKRGRRGRGKPKAPPTQKGTCPPGTYLLAVWFGKLCLLEPNMEFVCFLPLNDKQKSHFTIKKVKPEDHQPSKLAVDAVVDWADLYFDMPLGGKGVPENMLLRISARLKFAIGDLELAGNWVQEDPAKDLTAKLRTEWLAAEKKDAGAPKKANGADANGKDANGKDANGK